LNTKPNILVLLQYYLPGYKSGGPVRSIEGLAEHLGGDYDFRVVAYDRDSGDAEPYPRDSAGMWRRIGKTDVAYVPMTSARWATMARILRRERYSILYLQSLFNPCFTLWPLVLRRLGLIPKRPVLLAPRGELSQGALSIKSGKKRRFLAMARALGLFEGIHWQASSDEEAAEIRSSGLVEGGGVFVARNLRAILPVPEPSEEGRDRSGPLRIVFVSRIAPMKRLDGALRILQRVTAPVRFDVHGPIDRDKRYWEKCRELMDRLPSNVEAHYHGPAAPDAIPGIFARADAFLFPTLGENFGHVIAEALLAGCPVFLSDRTPWMGLDEAGCGINLAPDDFEGFAQAIGSLSAMPREEREEMRPRAQRFGIEGLRIEESLAAHRRMLGEILNESF